MGRPKKDNGEQKKQKLIRGDSSLKTVVSRREAVGKRNVVKQPVGGKIALYNNMRCGYILPNDLLYMEFKVDFESDKTTFAKVIKENFLSPGHSIEVGKNEFEKQLKGSKAFAALLSNRNLIAKDVKSSFDNADFEDVELAPAPESLDRVSPVSLDGMIDEPSKVVIKHGGTVEKEIEA